MDLILGILSIIGAFIGGATLGYKAGRGIRRDRYEANVSAREKAQQALSAAQTTEQEAVEKAAFLLLELPPSRYDEEKRYTDRDVKRLEDSVLQLLDPIAEAKQLQVRRFKTSPDNYSLNSEKLAKLTEGTDYHIHCLVRRVEDLGALVNALKPESLSVRLATAQERNIDMFKSYVRKTEIKSGSNRHGSLFKKFAVQVTLIQRTAETIQVSIDADKEDRYVLQRQIEQLEQDCETLWDVYIQLDPSASLHHWMRDYFTRHPQNALIDD